MTTWDAFYGPNAGYALELYERFQRDPDSVDAATRDFFERLGPISGDMVEGDGAQMGVRPLSGNGHGAAQAVDATSVGDETVQHIVKAARLARSIREYGHLAADIDPLGAERPGDPMLDPATHGITDDDLRRLPATIVWPAAGKQYPTCLDAIRALREIYSGHIGYDFDHIQNFDERAWLHGMVEAGTFRTLFSPERRRALLRRLTEVEAFERFLHTVFVGQKRFSIEGNDALVPMLDELIGDAAEAGTREVLIGMAHRGRLNVLAHVLGKPYAAIFAEFHTAPNKEMVPSEGSSGINYGWTGDVKYHLGARRTLTEGEEVEVHLTLADNPSHLEFVNPVVEGFARAAQDDRGKRGAPVQDVDRALPVTIHGDAAFPGEGVVAETLNLSRLPGYRTGGTIRIIANNQIGFTTDARSGRSTLYASDLAKGFEIPIVHVNADDPEACLAAVRLAHAYRNRFHKDFLIDLVGYRRYGHNEGDEPTFTQPALYAAISRHPGVRALYAEELQREGIVSEEEAQEIRKEVQAKLQEAREELPGVNAANDNDTSPNGVALGTVRTAVPAERLRELNQALLRYPEGFTVNPKLERVMQRRREGIEGEGAIDWAFAESLAFASILADGIPIRLTGQDTERGTFSQRHLVLHDAHTHRQYIALQALPQARASFAVYNSPLTEAAALGFEYGYSVHAPDAMVAWEAQFGDFANAGQVIIDQFIAGARAKWRKEPALVLLLPHGYEGQGPEHSSARLERYLQLAAEDNLRIANCTTAAQYFHLLRLQAATLGAYRRPLVLMTPKSLLRNPRAASSLKDLAEGAFQPVLNDSDGMRRADRVERLILCSGKIAVDLTTTARTRPEPVDWVAVARVELLYPFPEDSIAEVMAGYPNVREVVWLQEEPRNMGAWRYMALRLQPILPDGVSLEYIGRPERASTAEGSPDAHAQEQARIVEEAFGGERQARLETRGVQNAG